MTLRALLILSVGVSIAADAFADRERYDGADRCRPVGTWLVNVTFPDTILPTGQPLRFQQLLTLNADRTMSETNSGLHPNSNPRLGPPGPPVTGSDGFGTWKRKSNCRVRFSFLKFVFSGELPPMEDMGGMLPPMGDMPPPPPGVPIGFLKVSGIAKISGNMYVSKLKKVQSELILNVVSAENPFPNPLDENAPRIDFGDSFATGHRLLPHD